MGLWVHKKLHFFSLLVYGTISVILHSMKLGFEQLKKQYQEEPKEPGNFKVSEEGELLYRSPDEEKEIQTPDDFIDVLDRKIEWMFTDKVSRETRGFMEDPETFKKEFEKKTAHKSEDETMDNIDEDMKELSHLHDAVMSEYNLSLDQRLEYKDISDEVTNSEIKRKLDDRIHEAQQHQKNVLDLMEYLESKKVECILHGEKKGIFNEHTEEDETS